ncbi:trimeric LpxA-like protein [Gilbertella persicaria]|uniref:trimeric LpxA-like protein n=1 Tax=Gilbertella persicaria TaxID=101096 RepID=UPI002220ED34|nr:trimeric LpxA-like protein [Gilbertella persicaria]KAI8076654.1 trimeric LpxA-like protein [Gilbertella persicaria]
MSRNRITAGPKSIVCQETELKGEISIGSGTVLHPQCRIIAESGPIYIGKNNIIEENVVIFNKNSTPLVIGDDNEFEVGCHVEGTRIGNNNVVEARARILGSTAIGNYCVIGAACATESNETIPDLTVIYGLESKRRTQSEPLPTQATLHTRHLDYLREVLPKYNHLKKLEAS